MNVKENFYIYIYKEVLTFLGRFTALRFTVTDAPLAARRIQILPMNQSCLWPVKYGMKYTVHKSQKVLKMLSPTRRYSLHQQKRF
jgi:hypothetical protein